jgi:hypothetical protein
MKRIITAMAFVCLVTNGMAQDSTAVPQNDTIRVGNMIIIRSGKDKDNTYYDTTSKTFKSKNQNVTTNWWVIDIGFNRVNDNTNYASAIAAGYLPGGANENWFDQRNFKSTNVNIWIFMQRLNILHHVLNLKYGLGVELNNYKYTEPIRFQETNMPLVMMGTEDFKKNKLAADYVTVPLMLNFNVDPKKKNGFGFSVGVSAGFLYSSRQKTVGGGVGKQKYRDDYDLRDFKFSYIGEIGLGPVRLYGSYAMQSMFENTLDQTPYNFGIRLSHL